MPSPLDLAELPFLRDALVELVLLGLAGGVLGARIVLRRPAFFSTRGRLGHPPRPRGGGRHRGQPDAGGSGGGAGVRRRGRAHRAPREPGEATALLLVAAWQWGIVLASDVFESGAQVDRLLFGTLLGLGTADLVLSALAAAPGRRRKRRAGPDAAVAFDPDGARSLGVPADLADFLLPALVAVAAVAAIPAVGALLVTAIYVLPAAAARLLARSVPALIGWAPALALAQGLVGSTWPIGSTCRRARRWRCWARSPVWC